MNNSVLERVVGEIVEEEAMVGSVTAPASDGHGHAREQEAKLCTTASLTLSSTTTPLQRLSFTLGNTKEMENLEADARSSSSRV